MTVLTRAILLGTLVIPVHAFAQTGPLLPYTACKFDDGLVLGDKSPLPAGVQGRTVDTIAGPRQVPLLRGERLIFGYPATDPFANVKVEQLTPEAFEQGKADLIANFEYILASGNDSSRNMTYALHPTLNGFEVYGLDRKTLGGSTLGIYLLIDNRTHIVATAYFLNQGPLLRKFSTLTEYAGLRDHFLNAYTSCVHSPQAAAAVAVHAAARPASTSAAAHKGRPAAKTVGPHHKAKPAAKSGRPSHKN